MHKQFAGKKEKETHVNAITEYKKVEMEKRASRPCYTIESSIVVIII